MRIYVAARYSADNYLDIMKNIGIAVEAGIGVAKKGHYPFIPHIDYLLAIQCKGELPLDYYYKCSIEWLKCCDAILIVNGLKDSKGVKKEYEYAKSVGMKIYHNIKEIPNE